MGGMSSDQIKEVGLNGTDIAYHCDQPCVSLLGMGSTLQPGSDIEQTQSNSDSLGIKTNEKECTESSIANSLDKDAIPVLQTNETLHNIFKNSLQWQYRFKHTCPGMTMLPQSVKPPIYIVTGSNDTNHNYCYNALCGFKQLEYEVYFDDLKHVGHEYQSISTYDIWKFFTLYARR